MTTLRRLIGPLGADGPSGPPADHARVGNRRRLLVFGSTFLVTLVIGQIWNFSRPAEYRAHVRVQASLPEVGRAGRSASGAYETKLQLLNSRPLLARLADALAAQGTPAGSLERRSSRCRPPGPSPVCWRTR